MGLIEEIGDNCYAVASEAAWNGKAEQMQADKKHADIKERDAAYASTIGTVGSGIVKGTTKAVQHKLQNRKLPDLSNIKYNNSNQEQNEF